METNQIRLLPHDPPGPQPGHMPLRQARRWRSEFELLEPRQPGLEVFLAPRAYTRANAHAQSDLENEVGGWLIGSQRLDQVSGAALYRGGALPAGSLCPAREPPI